MPQCLVNTYEAEERTSYPEIKKNNNRTTWKYHKQKNNITKKQETTQPPERTQNEPNEQRKKKNKTKANGISELWKKGKNHINFLYVR